MICLALSENKKIYSIILEKGVKESIDAFAKSEDRSSSNLINYILKKFIEDNRKIKNE